MTFDTTPVIRLLTMISLAGLLFAVGLRLNWAQLVGSMRGIQLGWILPVNFLLVPAMTFVAVRGLGIPTDIGVGMLLLAAAPFAPVVPVFTKLARGDLALAGVLTALFPFASAFLTPLICELSLGPILGPGLLKFKFLPILIILLSTITLPLALGVGFSHYLPTFGRRLLRPLEIISEATGAISLIFVTVVEFRAIWETGWKPLLVMVLIFELSFAAGYILSGPSVAVRKVMALGTSNRNIALALLIAIQSFGRTPVLAAVVTNALVLIFLALLHVGFWRFIARPKERI